jgi:hypothetical protein
MKPLVTVAAWLLSGTMLTQAPLPTQDSPAKPHQNRSQLTSFTVQGTNLIAVGSYLARVEVCGVSSGTGIDPDSCNPIGEASRKTPAGKREQWVLTLPPYPVNYMVTEIYAKAYDRNGGAVGRKSLPVFGVSSIEEAMYPSADPRLFSHQDRIGLNDSGRTFVFADNEFPFSIALSNARYPASDFILDCNPKYDNNHPIITRMTRMDQDYHHLPGTGFYTATPGRCTVRNHDFSVNIEVLHGDWRD